MTPEHADVVLLAAGAGTRLGEGRPKGLVELGGAPLFLHSLRAFLDSREIDRVVIAAPPEEMTRLSAAIESLPAGLEAASRVAMVPGGAQRQDSTRVALTFLAESGAPPDRLVLIHDSARPFVSARLVHDCLEAMRAPWGDGTQARLPGIASAGEWGEGPAGVIPVIPVQDTLKLVYEDRIVLTQPRENLFAAQTPQAFRLGVILEAHRRAREVGQHVTDDASLLEWLGIPVRVLPGDGANWKITVPFDLEKAERWLAAGPRGRGDAES